MSGKFILMHTPVKYVQDDIVIDIRGLPNRYKTALGHLIGNQVAELTHASVSLHDENTISHYPLDEKEMGHIRNYFGRKGAPQIRIITTHTPTYAKSLLEEKIIELRRMARDLGQPLSIKFKEPDDLFSEACTSFSIERPVQGTNVG